MTYIRALCIWEDRNRIVSDGAKLSELEAQYGFLRKSHNIYWSFLLSTRGALSCSFLVFQILDYFSCHCCYLFLHGQTEEVGGGGKLGASLACKSLLVALVHLNLYSVYSIWEKSSRFCAFLFFIDLSLICICSMFSWMQLLMLSSFLLHTQKKKIWARFCIEGSTQVF